MTLRRWTITFEGCLLPFDYTCESYGDTEQEAIDYAVNNYRIHRSRIKAATCKEQSLNS